jgi:hypothetical protein
MSTSQIGRFIGPDKIADFQVLDITTPLGSPIFEVTYESGIKELFPEKGFAAVVSDEAKDLNHVRDRRVDLVVPQLVETIMEYNLPSSQIDWLLKQLAHQLDNRFGRAFNYLFYKDDKRYVPGYEPGNDFSILDAERVILSIPNPDESA